MIKLDSVLDYLETMEQVIVGVLIEGRKGYLPIEMLDETMEEKVYAVIYVPVGDYEDNGYEVDGLNWIYKFFKEM